MSKRIESKDLWNDSEIKKSAKDIANEISNIEKSLGSLVKTSTQIRQSFNQQAKSQEDLKNKTTSLQSTQDKLNKIEDERIALLNKLNKLNSDRIQKNEELKVQVANQAKANKQLAKEKLGLISAYEKESKRLNDLRSRYKDLAVQNKGNSKEAKKLQKEITSLDKKLKGIDSSVGQHQRSIGKYSDAMTALPGPIGGVIRSLKMLAKVIFATPLGWIIGLIAGAGAALKSFFTGSAEGQERWNRTMEKAKGVVSVFKDELIKAGKGLSDFVKGIRESDEGLKGWFKNIGDGLKTGWAKFKEDVSDKGFWKTIGDNAKSAYDEIAGKIKEIGDRLEENNLRAEQIAQKENKLRRDEIDNLTTVAQLQSDIAELRAQAADKENTTSSQRLEFLDNAIEKQNQILAIEENLAKRRIEIQKLQMAQGENTLEDYQKLAELEKSLIDLETTNAERRRRFQSERQTAIREIAAEEKAIRDKQEQEEIAFIDEELARIDKLVQAEINGSKKSVDEQIKNYEELNNKKKQFEEELKQQAIDGIDDLFQLRTAFRDSEIASLEKQRDYEVALAEEKGKSTADIEKKFADKERELRRKQAIQDKLQASFNIILDTAQYILKLGAQLGIAAPPFQIAAGVLGAAKLGIIAATPIPKFFKGVTDFMGGPAVVGDSAAGGSQTELVKLVSGEQFIVKNPTLMDLPKGTSVFTEQSKETREAVKGLDDTNIIKGLSRIEKKLSGNGGGLYWTEKGLERRDMINRNIVILRGRRSK